MDYAGWAVFAICLLAGGTLFFSVNAVALRIFSHGKLQEAFKAANKNGDSKNIIERLIENEERLILTCVLYRLIFNMCILLILVVLLVHPGQTGLSGNPILSYCLTFIAAMAIFSVFSLAIPHAWAKYAGEKILSRSYGLLVFAAIIVSPAI